MKRKLFSVTSLFVSAKPIKFTKVPPLDLRATRSKKGKSLVYQTCVVTCDCRHPVDAGNGHVYSSTFDAANQTYVVFSSHQAYPEYLITY